MTKSIGSSDPPHLVGYYAHYIDPEGHVVNEFDTSLRLYYTDEDLAELVELCKEDHREYQYLTHEIVIFGGGALGGVLYRWKRRLHHQEANIPLEQVVEFYDWLSEASEHAEAGEEPGPYDQEAYLAERAKRREPIPQDDSCPF